MCFSDYRMERKGRKLIIFGNVPRMYMDYNGILIIDGIHWFATDNKLDEEVKNGKMKISSLQILDLKK